MKKIKYILFIAAIGLLSSCLEYGLEELPAYDGFEMSAIKFEHRSWDSENNRIKTKALLPLTSLDTATYTYNCQVPLKGVARIDSLVCTCTISVGAFIAPVGNAPILGTIGDYTQPTQYEVTAANGVKQVWTLIVTELE